MTKVNKTIFEEIDSLDNASKDMRLFLKWIIDFEKNHEDKEQYAYKNEIETQLTELLILVEE